MASYRKTPSGLKDLRTYTDDEIAIACDVQKRTVRRWTKEGLKACTTERPHLYRGRDVRSFLKARARGRKTPCTAVEMYCVRCKAPSKPRQGSTSLTLLTNSFGLLSSICPSCQVRMFRFVPPKKILDACARFDVLHKGTSTINSDKKPPL